MKAAAIQRNGGLETIEVMDLDAPSPGPGQVLLEVKAAALNRLDVWVRKLDRFKLEFPHVLGSDAAGVVAELGHGVTGLEVGDEVVLDPGITCGQCSACRRGAKSLCVDFGIIGAHRSGTLAEKVVVPAENCRPRPEHLEWPQAAALTLDHLTAWRMLISRGKLMPGETVLIHGIGGGAALAGLQIAVNSGARAIVTSSSDDKLEMASRIGALAGINYQSTDDVAGQVKDLTEGTGVDVIFDSVGAATWPINMAAAGKGGRIVHCGVTGGAEVQANLSAIYWNQLSVLGSTMGGAGEMDDMLRFVSARQIVPVVDKIFPLDEIRTATERMENAEQFGKIVLEIN